MAALLLVAHGSRRERSNDEVRRITQQLQEAAGGRFAHISCAFLELADPLIPDGITGCIEAGEHEVIVLPYFLSAGRHVSEDIPDIITASQQQYPEASIRLAPYLGASADIIPALLKLATI